MQVYLAIDLGAGSGRLVAGKYDGSKLELEEVHRFSNDGVELNGACHWNTLQLFSSIQEGIRKAVDLFGDAIVSIAADSWGCDHAMLDRNGNMLGGHRQYRDPRTEGMQAELEKRMPLREVYAKTGVQAAFYNSSLHLLAERMRGNPGLDIADRLLFTPDLLAYWLSGEQANERTITSTSQLYNPSEEDWAWDVIDALELPRQMFGRIVPSGTVLGPVHPSVVERTGVHSGMQVVASAGHDTACAVAGLPMTQSGLWLSSGTWSIIGVESECPVTSAEAFEAGLSNEGGVEGTTRLLHNVAGMWMAQESIRHWKEQGEDTRFEVLDRLADEAEAFSAFIDPNAPEFASPGDMPERIREYCRKTGQEVPEDKGTILRVINESLALKYRQVAESLQQVTGKQFDCLNAGGGGTKNLMLMQSAADALGVPVVAGPVEATSCGNIMMQMVATGALPNVAAGRQLVADSMDTKTFTPQPSDEWAHAYLRFCQLTSKT
ncbi:rhamnulokinase [Verrucomicrobiaceae bacterium N1E253]|uniref:Rhamnulokinase n=1 Tax=Oceaniferula marina TaxID=2748318 RepID=A0A851GK02_9BACT|nr:rhamnulokinase family protein [Oceaniferula marina]NWK56191.1 rhamnulokinase [Oceaniferula marina]